MSSYYVYILRCGDGTLYTGITTDLARRFREHNGLGGRGAKYTASRDPVGFEAVWAAENRASASRLEYRLKSLSRPEKLALISGESPCRLDLSGYPRLGIDEAWEPRT